MQAALQKDKLSAIKGLESGLARECADDIVEVLVNLADGTCDYADLIPVLEKVAEKDLFYYFDDNGAGGFPRPDPRRRASLRSWALKAIENIKENVRFEADSLEAQALKSNDSRLIKTTLELLTASSCNDEKLIPILEKIARKDVYSSYSYTGSFEQQYSLTEIADKAIRKIRENCEGQARS
jgi:hypothetical protein